MDFDRCHGLNPYRKTPPPPPPNTVLYIQKVCFVLPLPSQDLTWCGTKVPPYLVFFSSSYYLIKQLIAGDAVSGSNFKPVPGIVHKITARLDDEIYVRSDYGGRG